MNRKMVRIILCVLQSELQEKKPLLQGHCVGVEAEKRQEVVLEALLAS